jgi:plastocyanin
VRRSPLLLVVLVWLVAGSARAATEHDHDVTLRENTFEPAELVIAPGETVRWTNRGAVAHSTTADNDSFDATMLPTEDFDATFDRPGRYPYHCTFHRDQGMRGVVIVRASSTTTSSSTTTTRPSRTTSTLEPGGSAITAPGETTTTTVEETTTTVDDTTTTTRNLDLAAGGDPGDSDDDTATGLAAALASLLLLGVSGGTLFLLRKGQPA